MVCAITHFLCVGIICQNDGVSTAGGFALGFMDWAQTNHPASAVSNCSLCRRRYRNRTADDMVGALSHRHAGRSIFNDVARTHHRGEPRDMVLRGQIALAGESHFLLSQMGHSFKRSVGLRLACRFGGSSRGHLLWQKVRWTKRRNSNVVLCDRLESDFGFRRVLYFSLHLCSRSLSIYREYRIDCFSIDGNYHWIGKNQTGFQTIRQRHAPVDAWHFNVETMLDVCRPGNTLAGYDSKSS